MSTQPNNTNMPTDEWPHDAQVIGSEGFRKAFLAVASRQFVGTQELDKPIKYIVEREKHRGLFSVHVQNIRRHSLGPNFPSTDGGIEKSSLFYLGDFNLSDALYIPFPLYLPHPEYKEVPKESIKAIDPILADIDVRYIRHALADRSLGSSIYQATQRYRIKESNGKEVRIVLEDSASVRPTHMLVVYAPINARMPIPHLNMAVSMFPVHSLVLAANCAKLAPFPPPINQNEITSDEKELVLPVVTIFPENSRNIYILLDYLARKRTDVIFAAMLRFQAPVRLPANPGEDGQVARSLAGTFSATHLFDILGVVTGLWDNACYLGVYDAEFWNVLDVVRRSVLMALAILKGRHDTLQAIEAVADALGRAQVPTGLAVKAEESESMTM